jgi:hypothetical protein
MAYLSSIIYFILFSQSSLWAQSKLPLFITKQDIRNIRYISRDGNITYYQRSNGSLQFATNYKVQEVLDLEDHTQFIVQASPKKKNLVIEVDRNFYQKSAIRKEYELYLLRYGDFKAKKIANGRYISHHGLFDEWVSYYKPNNNQIVLQNTVNIKIKHEFTISNKNSPYFTPQTAFINNELLLYTDIDSTGHFAIRSYNLLSKEKNTFIKLNVSQKKIELCQNDSKLFIWESSYDVLQSGTRITSIPNANFSLDKRKFHYQSPLNDIGSLKCNISEDKIFFIKTSKNKDGKYTFNAAEHIIKTGVTKVISDINFATSLIISDGKLLLPYQGKLYTLLGKNNMTQFDLLKKRESK